MHKLAQVFHRLATKRKLAQSLAGGGEGGGLTTMDHTGRLRPKAVPFSGCRCLKGKGFHELKYRKGLRELSFRYFKTGFSKCLEPTLLKGLIHPSILRGFSSEKFSKSCSVGI